MPRATLTECNASRLLHRFHRVE